MKEDLDPIDPKTGSHPVIQYRRQPIVEGELHRLNQIRQKLIARSAQFTLKQFEDQNLDLILGGALYSEKARMRKVSPLKLSYLSNLRRHLSDRYLWSKVNRQLLKSPGESDRTRLLKKVIQHYGKEIAGRFKPRVYHFATHAVPYGFSWLLNAISLHRIIPSRMTESLQDRIYIVGQVPEIQNLAKKGTIVLVPTHQSHIDNLLAGYVIYLMGLPPFSFGAGLNLYTNPVLNYFMGNLGAYTVDRAKSNYVYKAALKNYSTAILERGIHSIFYPGGGRSRSGGIESYLKLGLLGTSIRAQTLNLNSKKEQSKIFVVPMVTSYHCVLEGLALIEDFLAHTGKDRFMGSDAFESPTLVNIAKFFYKFFSIKTDVTVRIGRPLDVFGNPVDENGESIGPNGTTIDIRKWLTTKGELREEEQRDEEYTRQLGLRVVDQFYQNNTVLSSHLVAFSFFMALRKKFPELDLYRFLRLSSAQRAIPYETFLKEAEWSYHQVEELEKEGQLYLSQKLRTASSTEAWVEDGIRQVGLLHDAEVVKRIGTVITTEDMNLLYYYRNRLTGYGLTLLGRRGRAKILRGEFDEKGFLA